MSCEDKCPAGQDHLCCRDCDREGCEDRCDTNWGTCLARKIWEADR